MITRRSEKSAAGMHRGATVFEMVASPDHYSPEQVNKAMQFILDAFSGAIVKHRPFTSAHEGHSVITEELDELFDHVCADSGHGFEATREAAQIGAMALRYILDVGTLPDAGNLQNVEQAISDEAAARAAERRDLP